MTELGTDISALPGLDFTLKSGTANLGEAIARRLQTPHGGLFYDLDYGLDLRAWLNDSLDQRRLFALRGEIRAEVEKDPRVITAEVTATYSSATERLAVSILIETTTGTVPLVIEVSALTVELLGT